VTGESSGGTGELRVGELVETTIEKDVYRGRGLGRVGGRVLFVPRTFTGDRVAARVREVHPGWGEAVLESVARPAAARRVSPCEYVPRCGGCVYQELGYAAQIRAKESILRESLARAGAPWEGEIHVTGSPEVGWRLRASLHFSRDAEGLRLGLRQEGSRRVVDIDSCLQLADRTNDTLRGLRRALGERRALWPRLRGLDILESPSGEIRVVSLAARLSAREGAGLASLADALPGIDGFGVHAGRGRQQWLSGSPHIEAPVLGRPLQVHVRSFFQANRFLYEELARAVLDLLPGKGRVLDLYAGVGLFAVPLAARDGGEVIAVERATISAKDATANGRRNGLDRLRVLRSDVGDALATLRPQAGERVVLDPPRTGLERDVVRAVAERRPEAVVYVSCDPATLGRDLARFAGFGFVPDIVRAFDLFPDTFHLETIARLVPA